MARAEAGHTRRLSALRQGAGNRPASGSALPRQLTGWGLWLLMVNGMVGAGIFGVPAEAARLAGDFSPLLYLLCALLVAPVMLCFAELGSATRESGGPARYVAVAFGPMAGFQTGWALYVARMTAFAANLNLLLASLAFFWPALGGGVVRTIALALLTALLAWLNVVGVKRAIQSLGGLTLLKLGPLLLLAVVGLAWLPGDEPRQLLLPLPEASLGAAVLLMIYAYVGFESGLIPGGETKDPQRDMPRDMLGALAVCALLYALLQWICLVALDDLETSQRPLVELGTVLAWLLAATGSFFWLASLSVLTRVLIYVGCIASMPRVRREAAPGALRLPLAWAIPVAALAVCLLLVSQVTWQSAVTTAAMLAVGSGLYRLVRRRNR